MRLTLILLLTFSAKCHAFMVGNYAEPNIYRDGLVLSGPYNASVRVGYVADYTYQTKIEDQLTARSGETSVETDEEYIQQSTYAGIIALNFWKHLDLYAIFGSTKISDDSIGYVPRKFSWSVGAKATLFRIGDFLMGGDVKYFETKQKPSYYLLEDGEPAFVTTDFHLYYTETQASLGFAYDFGFIIPYAGATYLEAEVRPDPHEGGVDVPSLGLDMVFDEPTRVNKNQWGLVWGVSFLSEQTFSINVESRHFDERDVNVSGQIRF